MPQYQFTGQVPMTYPDSKDSHGIPVGEVQPGDRRDLDGPLGQSWEPVTEPPAEPPKPAPKAAKDKAAPVASDQAGLTGSKED